MKINLTEIKTYFIALETEKKQIERIQKMLLEDLYFKNIEHSVGILPTQKYLNLGPHCYPSAVGCGLSYLSILNKNTSYPFLILEGDAHVLYENFNAEIEVPDNCDCLYLGGSKHGTQEYSIKDYNTDYYQIQGMYAVHAVLYLNEQYVLAAEKTINEFLNKGIPFDVGLAEIQKNYNVLLPKKHYFYQYPINEEVTKPLFRATH